MTGCARSVPPGMLVCGEHADDLRGGLLRVPHLADALEEARCKRLRFAPSPLARPRDPEEAPLPFSLTAAAAERALVEGLRRAAAEVSALTGERVPLGTPDSLGPWLAEQVTAMRSAEAGPCWVEELRALLARSWRVVDAPREVRYAGPCGAVLEECSVVVVVPAGRAASAVVRCECGAQRSAGQLREVFAEQWLAELPAGQPRPAREAVLGVLTEHDVEVVCWAPRRCTADLWVLAGSAAGSVRCPGCRELHDVERRRAWLLEQVEDMHLPASELARAIGGLGVEVTPTTIRSWVHRRRLVAKGTRLVGGRVLSVFRIGDVLDLVATEAARRAALEARRGVSRAG